MESSESYPTIQVNRVAKTALEVFDDILAKPKLDRNDLQLIIRKIRVFEDHIEIQLKADIDSVLQSGTIPEGEWPAEGGGPHKPYEIQIIQESDKHNDKIFTVKVVSDGEDLRIDADKTQAEIAEVLSCKREVYRRYEMGIREIPVWALIKLAQYYHTSTDYILGLSNTRNPR